MEARLRIRLCGPLVVHAPTGALSGRALASRKGRTLLCLLASARGRLLTADEIAEVLWPEAMPADPAANVATLVSRARSTLGAAALVAQGRAYGIDPGAWSLDLDEVADLRAEARDRYAAGEPGLAAAAARRALELLGPGGALPEEDDAEWVLAVRREAAEQRREVRHLLAQATLAADPAASVTVSRAAVAEDPYDERAVRDLMRAEVAAGSPAAALAAYDALAALLREELGADPADETAQLHLAVLREQPTPPEGVGARAAPRRTPLVGREEELGRLDRLWARAGEGAGGLVLLDGEAGIGKTRLLDALTDLAAVAGGQVVRGRCHPAERSLFLQPFVDALRPLLLGAADPSALLRGHENAWVALLPELGELVAATPEPAAAPETAVRRSYDAVAAVLRRAARRRPVLLLVDDLQDGAAATVDLLGYLAGALQGSTVLLVGAVRAEELSAVARLADRATRMSLGPLPPSAVHALAGAAGLASRGAEVLARTAGHALSVVESLRALATGDTGVPESLAAAVLARVERLGDDERVLVLGASVLSGGLDPRTLADLVGSSELAVVRSCEELVAARLLHRSGARYEFANDLTQECLHASLPPALAAAYHRRAADLLTDLPEQMAAHAHAAGDLERAAQGWLIAGEAAMRRSAVEDAHVLFARALDAATDPTLRARALLARARAEEARASYDAAMADIDAALALAEELGDRRLQLTALRARGGDVGIAVRHPMEVIEGHLVTGREIAAGLGDRAAEAEFCTRLVVLDCGRGRLVSALAQADSALVRARAAGRDQAVLHALDGAKTVLSYLGEADRLCSVIAELQPLLRARHEDWMLQWAVLESAYPAAEAQDWASARARVEEACELNRRTGFTAYLGYFRAQLGWFARLAGDLDEAVVLGRVALAETSPIHHPWWFATASGILAGSLLDRGEPAEAAEVAASGLATTGPETPEAFRLRPLAALAAASGDRATYDAARVLLGQVDCPPGSAWVLGADCYLHVARAAERHGDDPGDVLAPLAAATRERWPAVRRAVTLLQTSSPSS